MKTTTMIAALAMLVASPVFAQQATPAPVAATPDPATLAAAERAVAKLVPDGVYMRMMRDQMPKLMDAALGQAFGMSAKDMGQGTDETPIGDAAAKADPHIRERTSIMMRVMMEEMGTVMGALEPRMRVGLAKAFARKFTRSQLDDMNAFFATPSGEVFAREYLLTFVEPELMTEMMSAMPEVMKAMPAIMKKAEDATSHLPPAPKPKSGDAK